MEIVNNDRLINLLPYGGTVNYYGCVIDACRANNYFEALQSSIVWKNDEAIIFGRHIITKRKAAWYGDNAYNYAYSGTTKQALPWTKELTELKTLVENITSERFNACLLNLYHNGDEGMAWHSDDERSLSKNSTIASLSFGAERKFAFKHKVTKETAGIMLQNGSLLIMKGATQTNWLHALPKTKQVSRGRVNLTFRTMV